MFDECLKIISHNVCHCICRLTNRLSSTINQQITHYYQQMCQFVEKGVEMLSGVNGEQLQTITGLLVFGTAAVLSKKDYKSASQ